MNKHIPLLIVDDEPINLKKALVALKDDFELHFAKSGKEALEYLKTNKVELILLDIVMDEMDGFEVAKQLQSDVRTVDIPIIFLTSDNSEVTIEKAFEVGAVDYITKPFRHKELLIRVKNRVETQQLKKHLENSLQRNEHLLEIVNNYLPYLKTDPDGIIKEISPSLNTMLLSDQNLVGENVNILKSGNMPNEFYKELWDIIESGNIFTAEIENHNFLEGTNWYKTTITPDLDSTGTIVGYIAFYINIDEKVRYEKEAYTDYLTGIQNRAKFESQLHEEIYRSKRYHQPLSLVLIDIDNFKLVNDTFGHDTGDIVLKMFAEILSNNIRSIDILARWGGEEFVILCPHTEISGALILAEMLRTKIAEYEFETVGHKTASFGVTQYIEGQSQQAFFAQVDQALYNSKMAGRNRVSSLK